MCAPELRAVGVRDPGRQRGLTLPDSVRRDRRPRGARGRPRHRCRGRAHRRRGPAAELVRARHRCRQARGDRQQGAAGDRTGRCWRRRRGERASRCASRPPSRAASPSWGRWSRTWPPTSIHAVRGIVNGTTNHILSAMARDARSYADVLAEAQARGYAEADPTRRRGGPRRGAQADPAHPARLRRLARPGGAAPVRPPHPGRRRPRHHRRHQRRAGRRRPAGPDHQARGPRGARPRRGAPGGREPHGRARHVVAGLHRWRPEPGRGRGRPGRPGRVPGPGCRRPGDVQRGAG